MQWDNKISQCFFIFNTQKLLSEHKQLASLSLRVRPTKENFALDPLAALHLATD